MKKTLRSNEPNCLVQGQPAPKTASKIARVLAYLLTGESINRFEAERIGDHCLHSTISALANGYGLTFERMPEEVPNHWGAPCVVTRYSLPLSERLNAHELLSYLLHRHPKQPSPRKHLLASQQ